MKDFKEIFTRPFILDDFTGDIVYTSNGSNRAFDINDKTLTKLQIRAIITCLNSDDDTLKPLGNAKLIYKDGNIIHQHGNSFRTLFTIRGWGHLTGISGLNLDQSEATKIQANFANWIINKLSDYV